MVVRQEERCCIGCPSMLYVTDGRFPLYMHRLLLGTNRKGWQEDTPLDERMPGGKVEKPLAIGERCDYNMP